MLTAEKVKNILTADDIRKLFVGHYGAPEPAMDAKGNHLYSTELCHGGDSPTKLVYYVDTHSFYCWTHCHAIDLFEIVRRREGFESFRQAFEFVVDFFGLEDDGVDDRAKAKKMTDDWDLLQRIEDLNKRTPNTYVEKTYSDAILSSFSPPCAPEEWIKDNISPDVMRHYGIRVDAAKSRIIIPHRNADGALVGIRARAFDPFELTYAKYSPITIEGKAYNFPTGRYLFGLYQNKATIRKMRKVVICEGEKSVLQSASYYGVDNSYCVATCGSSISKEQINLLLELGVEEVILGYDRDFMGFKGDKDVVAYEEKLYKVITPLLPYFNVYVLFDYDHMTGYKDSPMDKGKEVFERLWEKKIYVPPIGKKQIRRK